MASSVVWSTFQILELLLMCVCINCGRFYTERRTMEGCITSLPTLGEYDLISERTMCSRLCNRNNNCMSYFENVETKLCRLESSLLDDNSGNLIQVPGWKYYARAYCNVENGYVFDPQSSFCFKYFKDSKSITSAQSRCAEDSGRLIEIRNERQQLVVAEHLANIEARHGYGPTIAGRRSDNTNSSIWLFDDGTEAEYFHWDTLASNPEPIDNRNCIKLEYDRQYFWATALCYRKQPFLCQVP